MEPRKGKHRADQSGGVADHRTADAGDQSDPPPAATASPVGDQFVIWSLEHRAWWRPFGAGYADTLAEAGVFDAGDLRTRALRQRAQAGDLRSCFIPVLALRVLEDDSTNLKIALEESVKLQSHYAQLLNMHDGGQRHPFANAAAWLARLRETGTIPRTP